MMDFLILKGFDEKHARAGVEKERGTGVVVVLLSANA